MKEILLTKNYFAQVDDEDFEKLSKYKWHVQVSGGRKIKYAVRLIGKYPHHKAILMHRAILKLLKNERIDHKDFNGLNNQKSNLRICTVSQNTAHRRIKKNSLGLRGVCWDKSKNKYKASLSIYNRHIHLGYFNNPFKAAKKYNEAASSYYGEFAVLNKL